MQACTHTLKKHRLFLEPLHISGYQILKCRNHGKNLNINMRVAISFNIILTKPVMGATGERHVAEAILSPILELPFCVEGLWKVLLGLEATHLSAGLC